MTSPTEADDQGPYRLDFDSAGMINIYSSNFRRRLIGYRMRLPKGPMHSPPWDALESTVVDDEVVVWIAAKGKTKEMKDPIDTFPSDGLIAQIRQHIK